MGERMTRDIRTVVVTTRSAIRCVPLRHDLIRQRGLALLADLEEAELQRMGQEMAEAKRTISNL